MPESDQSIVLVTWFHADAPDNAGIYSQTLGDSASDSHYEAYLRCIDVCTASFRRWNKAGRVLVVLNPLAESIISVERLDRWARYGVQVVVQENHHLPDKALYDSWQNQTYLFDVLSAVLAQDYAPSTPVFVIDSDVLVREDLTAFAFAIQTEGRIHMEISLPEDYLSNGLSRSAMTDLYGTWAQTEAPGILAYLGGELVASTVEQLAWLHERCEDIYRWSIARQAAGKTHPNEEAHIISMADPALPGSSTGNRWLERLWTQPWNFRFVPPNVASIPLWHLPAENRTGFARIHNDILDQNSWFWVSSPERWAARTARTFGIPRYRLRKRADDTFRLGRARIARALRRE